MSESPLLSMYDNSPIGEKTPTKKPDIDLTLSPIDGEDRKPFSYSFTSSRRFKFKKLSEITDGEEKPVKKLVEVADGKEEKLPKRPKQTCLKDYHFQFSSGSEDENLQRVLELSKQESDITKLTEDEQLKLAMARSLKDTGDGVPAFHQQTPRKVSVPPIKHPKSPSSPINGILSPRRDNIRSSPRVGAATKRSLTRALASDSSPRGLRGGSDVTNSDAESSDYPPRLANSTLVISDDEGLMEFDSQPTFLVDTGTKPKSRSDTPPPFDDEDMDVGGTPPTLPSPILHDSTNYSGQEEANKSPPNEKENIEPSASTSHNSEVHHSPAVLPEVSQAKLIRTRADYDKFVKHNQTGTEFGYSYDLVGVISHLGHSSRYGHYINDVYNVKDSKWLSYNDSQVNISSIQEVTSRRDRSGYVFFYMDRMVLQDIQEASG